MSYSVKEDIIANAVSMAADFTSEEFEIRHFHLGWVQFKWTGANTVDATLIVEATAHRTLLDWKTLDSFTINDVNGCGVLTITDLVPTYMRVRFAHATNSAGTINCVSIIKSLK